MKTFNPIISKAFIYSNLRFSNTGLYYVNKADNDCDDIFITNIYKDIISLLGYDFDEFTNMTEEEFFSSLVHNKKIKINKFFEVKENNSVELYQRFADYLKDNIVDTRSEYKKVSMSEFSILNPNFHSLLEDSNIWLSKKKEVNRIFNGATIKKYFPSYDMSILNETIPLFKNSFNSKRDFELYILKTDVSKIHEEFIKTTTKII